MAPEAVGLLRLGNRSQVPTMEAAAAMAAQIALLAHQSPMQAVGVVVPTTPEQAAPLARVEAGREPLDQQVAFPVQPISAAGVVVALARGQVRE